MLKLYDVVRTKIDHPELQIKKTYIGTIVDVINNGDAYTVEFINDNGDVLEDALFTEFYEKDLIRISETN